MVRDVYFEMCVAVALRGSVEGVYGGCIQDIIPLREY